MTGAGSSDALDAGGPAAHLLMDVESDEVVDGPEGAVDAYANAVAEAKDAGGPPADLLFELEPDHDIIGDGNERPGSGDPSPESTAIDVGAPPAELFQPPPGEDDDG